jgi:hypothetical protein
VIAVQMRDEKKEENESNYCIGGIKWSENVCKERIYFEMSHVHSDGKPPSSSSSCWREVGRKAVKK